MKAFSRTLLHQELDDVNTEREKLSQRLDDECREREAVSEAQAQVEELRKQLVEARERDESKQERINDLVAVCHCCSHLHLPLPPLIDFRCFGASTAS